MKLTLGISPCPNDTYIFHALLNNKINTHGLQFTTSYDDVETLNQKAFNNTLNISKLSFHAMAYVLNNYQILTAGSALGFGVGPLLISARPYTPQQLANAPAGSLRVGIPGKYTTAHLLLSMAFPHLTNKVEMVFSDIEERLLNNEIDLGLIIHENRFTYQRRGLHKVIDLGTWWENETHNPIPLGGIVIQKNLPHTVKHTVNTLIRQSIQYAIEHPGSGLDYIRSHAQEMDPQVLQKHIDLYVNDYSLNLGPSGMQAINSMFSIARQHNIIPPVPADIFIE